MSQSDENPPFDRGKLMSNMKERHCTILHITSCLADSTDYQSDDEGQYKRDKREQERKMQHPTEKSEDVQLPNSFGQNIGVDQRQNENGLFN